MALQESGLSNEADAITDLPAPTDAAVSNVDSDSADGSWTDNHNNGQTRFECRPTGESGWGDAAPGGAEEMVARGTGQATLTGLRNGEQYDWRVVAVTEHAETVDQ